MKHFKKVLFFSFLACLIVTLTACGGGEKRISIGTGGSGGVFYVLGAGLGNLITNESEDLELTAQSTAATAENLNLTDQGDLDFSFSVYDAAIDAFNGEGEYDRAYENLRMVMAGHFGYFHVIVREDSDIESMEDLAGARIGISPGDIGEKLMDATIEPYGMSLDDVNATAMSFTEMGDALRDGTIDVATVTAGLPASAVIELETAIDIRFLSHTDEGIDTLINNHPYWVPADIPASTYSNEEDIITFAAPYVIVANQDVDDETVYDFLDIMISENEQVIAIHPEGEHYTLDNELYDQEILVPYHSGAEEYLKENGAIE